MQCSPSTAVSAPSSRPGLSQAIGALQRHPSFRYLWGSNLFFSIGNWMQLLVMGWLTYELTGSAFLLALVTFARLLPMVLGPIGGILADRLDRIKLLLVFSTLATLITVVLALLITTGHIQFWHMVVIGFLLGMSQSPSMPARQTVVMDIVGKADVANAVALNTVAFDVTRVVGPAVGGLLIQWIGAAGAIWISAAWYVIATISLLPLLNRIPASPRNTRSPLKELAEGLRIILGNRDMLAVLYVTLLVNALVYPILQTFMPVFAKDVFHVGPSGLGLLLTCSGVGALIGAILAASLGDFRWKGHLFVWGGLAYGLFFALFAFSPSFPLSLVLIGMVGVALSTFQVMQWALMLILAPPEVRGLSMGVLMMAIGIQPLAALGLGAMASILGISHTTAIVGSLLAINMLALFFLLPSLRHLR